MPDFKTAEAQQFWDYWRSLQDEQLVPRKNQFSPGQIRHLMPDLFILKCESRDICRFTLVGTHHIERCGEELTGTNFLDRVPESGKPVMADAMGQVIGHPVANHLLYEEITAKGRRTMIEMIQLPLSNASGDARSIVGIAKEFEAPGYNLEPAKPHAYMSRISMQTYLDIGAGIPEATALGSIAARP